MRTSGRSASRSARWRRPWCACRKPKRRPRKRSRRPAPGTIREHRCRRPRSRGSVTWPPRRRGRSTTSAAPPPTGGTPAACSRVARSRGRWTTGGPDARPDARKRGVAHGRGLAGREPARDAARSSRASRIQERVRTRRVRIVLGVARRDAGLRVPRARRPGLEPGRPDGGRVGAGRRAASGSAGVSRHRGGAVRVLHAGPDRRRRRSARAPPVSRGSAGTRGALRQPVPVHRVPEDHRRGAARVPADARGSAVTALLISSCEYVVTVDDAGTEIRSGSLLIRDGVIAWIGPGEPTDGGPARRVDGRGTVALPGLINTHHHLYQALTRVRAQDRGLFDWLRALYPVWAGLDAEWSAPPHAWRSRSWCCPGAPRRWIITTCSRAAVATSSMPRWRRPGRSASDFIPPAARWTAGYRPAVSRRTRWCRTPRRSCAATTIRGRERWSASPSRRALRSRSPTA